jgi:hypothetical protein
MPSGILMGSGDLDVSRISWVTGNRGYSPDTGRLRATWLHAGAVLKNGFFQQVNQRFLVDPGGGCIRFRIYTAIEISAE